MAHHVDDVCGGGCVGDRRNSRTIPTVENLWGGSFLFPPEPLFVFLLSAASAVFFSLCRRALTFCWHVGVLVIEGRRGLLPPLVHNDEFWEEFVCRQRRCYGVVEVTCSWRIAGIWCVPWGSSCGFVVCLPGMWLRWSVDQWRVYCLLDAGKLD